MNLVIFPQVQQHGVMDALPETGPLPGMQTPPATRATAATQFTGRIFPRQAGLENEQHAGLGAVVGNATPGTYTRHRFFIFQEPWIRRASYWRRLIALIGYIRLRPETAV
nr:hypothetical protein [Janthinobacterium lividum]